MCINIGWSDFGYVKSRFMNSLIRTTIADKDDRNLIHALHNNNGTLLSFNRNKTVIQFLDGSCDWLLMVDADTIWTKEDVYALYDLAIKNDIKVLGATYFMYDNNGKHHSTAWFEDGSDIPKNMDVKEYIDKEIVKVDWCGLGALLIHRSVLEKTACRNKAGTRYWFAELSEEYGFVGEDFFFFENLKKNDVEIYVTPQIIIPHQKETILDSKSFILEIGQ